MSGSEVPVAAVGPPWWLGARLLVWLLAWAFLTGGALLLWFDVDAAAHREGLPLVGVWLRALHGAAAALLVIGTLGHVGWRLRVGRASSGGIRSGSLALLATGVAAVTGALIAQTEAAHRLAGWTGLASLASMRTVVLWSAVLHVTYAAVMVLVAVYFHVARWGWRYVMGQRAHGVVSVALLVAVALALGASLPGDGSVWTGATWLAVPPLPWLWAWTLVLAAGLWFAGSRRR